MGPPGFQCFDGDVKVVVSIYPSDDGLYVKYGTLAMGENGCVTIDEGDEERVLEFTDCAG